MLRRWQLTACELFPPSSHVFFGLIQQLILAPIDAIGQMVVRYGLTLPKGSTGRLGRILRERRRLRRLGQVCFCCSFRTSKFSIESDEERMRARFEITLLHCAAMLCSIVSEHPCYGNVVQVLRHNLRRCSTTKRCSGLPTVCVQSREMYLSPTFRLLRRSGRGRESVCRSCNCRQSEYATFC
jgi:hypothetical protein